MSEMFVDPKLNVKLRFATSECPKRHWKNSQRGIRAGLPAREGTESFRWNRREIHRADT